MTVMVFMNFLTACLTWRGNASEYISLKDLAYDKDQGEGVGYVSDYMKLPLVLPKGTKIKITTRKRFDVVVGSRYDGKVIVITGPYKGKEIYVDTVKDWDSAFEELKVP